MEYFDHVVLSSADPSKWKVVLDTPRDSVDTVETLFASLKCDVSLLDQIGS